MKHVNGCLVLPGTSATNHTFVVREHIGRDNKTSVEKFMAVIEHIVQSDVLVRRPFILKFQASYAMGDVLQLRPAKSQRNSLKTDLYNGCSMLYDSEKNTYTEVKQAARSCRTKTMDVTTRSKSGGPSNLAGLERLSRNVPARDATCDHPPPPDSASSWMHPIPARLST